MLGSNSWILIGGIGLQRTDFDHIILSLYSDQIRPYEVDIVRRAVELNFLTGGQDYSRDCGQISIDQTKYKICFDGTGKRFVELRFSPEDFQGWIDPNDTSNPMPIEMWEGMHHFVVCLCTGERRTSEATGEDPPMERYYFKGGRYGLAKRLQECVNELYKPDFREHRCIQCKRFLGVIQFSTLGSLCQLIQTGIQAGILRYEDNVLQPAVSCKIASTALAARLLPALPPRNPEKSFPVQSGTRLVTDEISSISELEEYLELLFRDSNASELPLSQLKKRLIGDYQIVLNPSRLGFIKISDVVRQLASFRVISSGNNAYIVKHVVDSYTPSTCITEDTDPLNCGL